MEIIFIKMKTLIFLILAVFFAQLSQSLKIRPIEVAASRRP